MAEKSTPQRLNLTMANVASLEAPKEGRVLVRDEKVHGLCVRITAKGAKAFYVYRRGGPGGRPVKVKLGSFPAMNVDDARKAATKVNGKLDDGADPNEGKRERRLLPNLEQLFTEYLTLPTRTKAKRPKSPKTIADYQKQFDGYLAAWKHRNIATIKRSEIVSLQNKLAQSSGHATANRVVALLKAMFNSAIEAGHNITNPAARIGQFDEQSRERFLDAAELRSFFAALQAEPSEKMRDFFLFLLMTGQRRGNVQTMTWDHVNAASSVWTIPAEQTKNRQPMMVALGPQALEILERRRAATGGAGYVFPGRHKARPLKDPFKAWRGILERSGLKDLTPHDLRRTLGSWQAATGASLPIIGRSLGHKDQAATAIYARLNVEGVRQAVTTATGAMMAAVAPAQKALPAPTRKGGKKGQG